VFVIFAHCSDFQDWNSGTALCGCGLLSQLPLGQGRDAWLDPTCKISFAVQEDGPVVPGQDDVVIFAQVRLVEGRAAKVGSALGGHERRPGKAAPRPSASVSARHSSRAGQLPAQAPIRDLGVRCYSRRGEILKAARPSAGPGSAIQATDQGNVGQGLRAAPRARRIAR